jgi:hypothetical protein
MEASQMGRVADRPTSRPEGRGRADQPVARRRSRWTRTGGFRPRRPLADDVGYETIPRRPIGRLVDEDLAGSASS